MHIFSTYFQVSPLLRLGVLREEEEAVYGPVKAKVMQAPTSRQREPPLIFCQGVTPELCQ